MNLNKHHNNINNNTFQYNTNNINIDYIKHDSNDMDIDYIQYDSNNMDIDCIQYDTNDMDIDYIQHDANNMNIDYIQHDANNMNIDNSQNNTQDMDFSMFHQDNNNSILFIIKTKKKLIAFSLFLMIASIGILAKFLSNELAPKTTNNVADNTTSNVMDNTNQNTDLTAEDATQNIIEENIDTNPEQNVEDTLADNATDSSNTLDNNNVNADTANVIEEATNDTPLSNTPDDVSSISTAVSLTNTIQVGYKKYDDSSEKVISDAIVCASTSEITSALKKAKKGSTIYIKGGEYKDYKFSISLQGDSKNYISIKNYPGETPIFINSQMKINENSKYLNIDGLAFKDFNGKSNFDYCIKVVNGCSNITFKNMELSNITCTNPSKNGINPIIIYGDGSAPIKNIVISNCYIHDCTTGYSEALTIEGNTQDCTVKKCTIDKTGNIGVDIAGNFAHTGSPDDPNNQARNITVTQCVVKNCNSPNATSAGLYCDGARNVTFSHNILYNNQCGVELGAEEPGSDVHDFYVYNNLVVNCGRAISAGAYLETGAKHYNSYVYNNTIICKDKNAFGDNYALYLERTSNFNFFNNIIYAKSSSTKFFGTSYDINKLNISNNCWYTKGGKTSKPKQDKTGIYADPSFVKLAYTLDGNFTLNDNSPCKDIGTTLDNKLSFLTDLNGSNRIVNNIDLGAYEK